MDKKRNVELDIIKGLCIVAIVFNHVGHNIMWFNYFMVIGFYFVAGCTFKKKSTLVFIKDKMMRIYVPFVLANLLVLFILKFYSSVVAVQYKTGNLDLLYNIKHFLMFDLTNVLMAPSWFLFPLSIILFIFHFLNKIVKKDYVVLGITFVIFILTHVFWDSLKVFNWNNCAFVTNVGLGLFICACGYFLKNNPKIENTIFNGKFSIEAFLIATFIMYNLKGNFWHGLRVSNLNSKIYNFFVTFVAIYFLVYLAKIIAKSGVIGKILSFVGQYSLPVMFFHLIAGSLVTIVVHFIFNKPFPKDWTRLYTGGVLGVVSGIVGIDVPVLLAWLYDNLKVKCLKRNKQA